MNRHLYILYLLISFFSGMVFLIPGAIIFMKMGKAFKYYSNYKHYFPFFTSLTILIFSNAIYFYVLSNIQEAGYNTTMAFIIIQVCAIHLIMVFLPLFIHNFFSVPFARKANIFFINLSAVSIVVIGIVFSTHFIKYIPSDKTIVYLPAAYILNGLFLSISLYSIIMAVIYFRKMADPVLKKMVKTHLILIVIIFPGIFFESTFKPGSITLTPGFLEGYIFPGFYFVWSLLSAYFAIKYFLQQPFDSQESYPTENFVKEYKISKRELEIIKLLMMGCSNSEICDDLSITLPTVKTHIHNIFQKTGSKSRTELLSIVIQDI